jgi:hypothetical protein
MMKLCEATRIEQARQRGGGTMGNDTRMGKVERDDISLITRRIMLV